MDMMMQDAGFDRARADALVQDIGAEIVQGRKFAARPWRRISIVADLDGGRRMFGYVYWGEDEWEAATPDGFTALSLFGELQAAMTVPGQAPWKKALVRIDRDTGKIDFDLDYDGTRWRPDPADPEGFAKRLR